MAADHTAFVDQYIIELRDLTFNSKPIINTLTMLASENKAAGSGIADALERHIKLVSSALTQAPPAACSATHLLPALATYGVPWLLMQDVSPTYDITTVYRSRLRIAHVTLPEAN